MGIRQKLAEALYKMRIIPNETPADGTSFAKQGKTLPEQVGEAIDSGKRVDTEDLLKLDILKASRNKKYEIFEQMETDGRIGAALEMYANDTVQYDSEGKILTVTSDNPDVAKYVEKLIKDLHLEQNCWSHAYRTVLHGDVYLKLFKSSSNDGEKPTTLVAPTINSQVRLQQVIIGQNLERYIELVPNPANIYDLQYKGKTAGYAKCEDDLTDVNNELTSAYYYTNATHNIDLMGPTEYVHICLSPDISRFPEKFRLIKDNINNQRPDGTVELSNDTTNSNLVFNVKKGRSVLENVYQAYQTLKLKEDSVLLERITKSSITRIIQVELGDLPEPQKKMKLEEIKQQIEQQLIMNKDTGNIQSRPGAQSIENIIYTSTNNGKGVINAVNIGGDADIGNIDDIDKSENKVYGSLLIPKALLGADMEGSGLNNGGSLTEMNTTYARRIKRCQQALIDAYTTLVNIFALAEGVGDLVVNNFQLRLTPIITIEDSRRDELLDQKIRNSDALLSLIEKLDQVNDESKLEIVLDWLTNYLGQQDAADIIKKQMDEEEQENEEEQAKDIVGEPGSENLDNDINMGPPRRSSFEPPMEEPEPEPTENGVKEPTEELTPDLNTPPQADLNDIEGEDLL